jgi:L-iditol 2-dehydrogenase
LVEPLAVALRASSLTTAAPGDNVMIIGAGAIGLLVIRMMKARGVQNCLVIDTNSARLKWAQSWGASHVANPKTEDIASLVKSMSAGDGMDCVVDAVGSSQTRTQSVSLVRRGGKVVWVGLHENESVVLGNDVVRSEKQIIGSMTYSDDEFRRAALLANNGFIETKSGWFDTRSLDSGQTSFMEQASESAPCPKILLDPKL